MQEFELALQDDAGAPPIDKLGEQHHKMIDWMLTSYTGKNLGELAELVGYSRSWLSSVINCDAFQSELARRRMDLNDETHERIVKKTMKLAETSLDALQEVLTNADEEELDPRMIVDVMDKTLHRLGYAPNRPMNNANPGGNVIQNNYFSVPREDLAAARKRMMTKALDGQVVQPMELEYDQAAGAGRS